MYVCRGCCCLHGRRLMAVRAWRRTGFTGPQGTRRARARARGVRGLATPANHLKSNARPLWKSPPQTKRACRKPTHEPETHKMEIAC